MAVGVYDRWHKSRAKPGERTCKEHSLVPSTCHNEGLRWQVRWDVWTNGKRSQPKRNFKYKVGKDPEVHADAFADKIRAELAQPTRGITTTEIAVREVIDEWLSLRVVAADTTDYTVRSLLIRHVCQHQLGSEYVSAIEADPNLIQRWIKDRKDRAELSASTVRHLAGYLGTVLEYARVRKYIATNPMRPMSPLIHLPKVSQTEIVPFTRQQLSDLTEHHPERYRIVVKAGSGLGLRIGEIMGLSPDDVIGNNVHVRRQVRYNPGSKAFVFALPKGGKTRYVPLANSIAEFLATLPAREVALPWDSADGKMRTFPLYLASRFRPMPTDYSTLKYWWNKAHDAAGIPRIPHEDGFHKLRHTFASLVLRDGTSVRELAEYLGHDDPAFTLRVYCHFMRGDGENIRQSIDRHVP